MQSVYFYLVLVIFDLKNLIQSETYFEYFKQKYILKDKK